MQQEILSNRKTETAHPEGSLTKAIEKQTAKIPSSAFLWLAGGAIAVSLGLALTKEKKGPANFIGLWVPSLLLLGIYNKIVKTHGSEKPGVRENLH